MAGSHDRIFTSFALPPRIYWRGSAAESMLRANPPIPILYETNPASRRRSAHC